MKFKHFFLFIFFISAFNKLSAQNTDLYGQHIDICPIPTEIPDNKDAEDALNRVCNAADIPNNFTLLSCPGVGNCFALYKDGVSYIVYDPQFFKRVLTFRFTEKSLPGSTKKLPGSNDWVALTILAHELGHHLCQHTTNPALSSKYTPIQLELQADEFAGSIMHRLGATLAQAQQAMRTDIVSEAATDTHPARKDRLAAIAKGYNKIANNGQNNNNVPVDPPSNGKITMIIPLFQVTAPNVKRNIAEQMRQTLVSDMVNDGTYNIIASSFDLDHVMYDPAVAYGGPQAIKKANYMLLGKITSYEEKPVLIFKDLKTIHYSFSFEVINAKTKEIVLVKNWELKTKSGKINITIPGKTATGQFVHNTAVPLNADVAGTYQQDLKDVIKSITDQKSKIALN